ncbi:MAG: ribbon-helix-helix protein, CopG family [Deferribacteraceae bacterium]|jgi:predicted transcriptional regulator|nr:ribbon-helix-helix protein, CopG family [Deferribacteraceae bacterium]
MKTMISTRADEDIITAIDEIAANMEMTRSDVVNEAMRHYIDYIMWFKDEVQRGKDDINAGCIVSHEDAISRFKKIVEG